MRNCGKLTAASLFVLALLGTQARADALTVQSSVGIEGFTSTTTSTGFQSTDAFDGRHTCTTTNGTGCTTSNGYDHPPKNIHEWLCIPAAMQYQLTSGCSTLVNRNDDGDCHGNDPADYCIGSQGVGPVCQWRTMSSGTASWKWTVAYRSSAPYSIDCNNDGYSGTH
ncbi:MAG: hypothetical protein ABSD08_19815 [Xanthobacteraceae bacterium]|jgi:hypothetical protein